MDFESRDALWLNFIKSEEQSLSQNENICKVCAALEILKVSLCREKCNDCEKNLLEIIFPDLTQEILENHMNAIKINLNLYPKLLEIEEKIPFYNESCLRIIEELEKKIYQLECGLEKITAENKSLKTKIFLAQAYNLEYKEKYEKYLEEIEKIVGNQTEIREGMENIGKDFLFYQEVLFETKKSLGLDEKIKKLDTNFNEEFTKVDEIWGNAKRIKNNQEKIEKNHESIKIYMKHCKNLDEATENVLNYHHKFIEFQKNIDEKLHELCKNMKELKLEIKDEIFKREVMELRNQTNEKISNMQKN